MPETTESRSDLVILGVVLGLTLSVPGGLAGRLLRGWFLLMGLCTGIRSVTVRKFPKADRLLNSLVVVAGLAGLIGTIVSAVFF